MRALTAFVSHDANDGMTFHLLYLSILALPLLLLLDLLLLMPGHEVAKPDLGTAPGPSRRRPTCFRSQESCFTVPRRRALVLPGHRLPRPHEIRRLALYPALGEKVAWDSTHLSFRYLLSKRRVLLFHQPSQYSDRTNYDVPNRLCFTVKTSPNASLFSCFWFSHQGFPSSLLHRRPALERVLQRCSDGRSPAWHFRPGNRGIHREGPRARQRKERRRGGSWTGERALPY